MSLFFIVFVVVYGGMHLLFARHCFLAFDFTRPGILALSVFCLGMVSAPFLSRAAETAEYHILAKWLTRCGFTWMGLLFTFLVGTGIAESGRALLALVFGIAPSIQGYPEWYRFRFGIGMAWVFFVFLWGIREADDIRLVRVPLQVEKTIPEKNRWRVVQISDLHLGPLALRSRIERVVGMLAETRADLIVASGDIIDGPMTDEKGLADLFSQIRPPYGKYLVLGNHEWYAGLPQAARFAAAAGFTLLRNEAREVASGVVVAGVDDPAGAQMGASVLPAEERILPEAGDRRLVLFLKHRPEVPPRSVGRFDLQFSGHTHQGQIAPFGLVVGLFNGWPTGLSTVGGGSWIYNSRGTGTWGPPIRFFSPPEIVCFDITCNPSAPGNGKK